MTLCTRSNSHQTRTIEAEIQLKTETFPHIHHTCTAESANKLQANFTKSHLS